MVINPHSLLGADVMMAIRAKMVAARARARIAARAKDRLKAGGWVRKGDL